MVVEGIGELVGIVGAAVPAPDVPPARPRPRLRRREELTHLPGLEGRTVVVTGAAGGQGAAAALLLASSGARVIATDLADHVPAYDDTGVTYRRLDVTDEAGWIELAAELSASLDGQALRGLVNNAGITHRARLGETERADWDRVLAVNPQGRCSASGISPADGRRGRRSSTSGRSPGSPPTTRPPTRPRSGAARAHPRRGDRVGPRGIRVNIVHPGFIETTMTAGAPAAMRDTQLALTPLERTGAADEVAQVVAFLLSDAAAYLVGCRAPGRRRLHRGRCRQVHGGPHPRPGRGIPGFRRERADNRTMVDSTGAWPTSQMVVVAKLTTERAPPAGIGRPAQGPDRPRTIRPLRVDQAAATAGRLLPAQDEREDRRDDRRGDADDAYGDGQRRPGARR